MPVIMPGSGAATMVSFDFGRFVLAEDYDALRARLAAAKSRLREYEDAPVVASQYQCRAGLWHNFVSEAHRRDTELDGSWPIRQLIIRPRGGKGE